MHRTQAYISLANELEKWRLMPGSELAALVGATATRLEILDDDGLQLEIEISVAWEGTDGKAVRVLGSANGPSSWRLERLQESLVVPLLQVVRPAY